MPAPNSSRSAVIQRYAYVVRSADGVVAFSYLPSDGGGSYGGLDAGLYTQCTDPQGTAAGPVSGLPATG